MAETEKRSARKEQAARTREEILEAAIKEFSEHSFASMTMAQLAKAIKMTPGALYWHFDTKEDVLLAAIDELNSRFLREFEFLIREGRSLTARQQLQGFLDRTENFFRYHTHYGKFFAMLTALSADVNERVTLKLKEVLALYGQAVAHIVRYGQEKTGEFPKDVDAQALAHVMVSGFCGIIAHQILFKGELPYDSLAKTFERMAMEAVRPKSA